MRKGMEMEATQKLNRGSSNYQLDINEINNGVLVFNDEGSVLDTNNAFCRMTGFERNEVVGKQLASLLFEKGRNRNCRMLGVRSQNGRKSFEVIFKTKNKNEMDVLISVMPVANSEDFCEGCIAILIDITYYKEMGKKLGICESRYEAIKEKMEEVKTIANLVVEGEVHQKLLPVARFERKAQTNLKLTRSEFVIAELVNRGKTSKEIAVELCLSVRTVSNHRQNIRRKLGLVNKKKRFPDNKMLK